MKNTQLETLISDLTKERIVRDNQAPGRNFKVKAANIGTVRRTGKYVISTRGSKFSQ
jgi:hypothetical protein